MVELGGGHSMAGTVLYCRSTVTGCSGWQGDLVMCFPSSTVARCKYVVGCDLCVIMWIYVCIRMCWRIIT